MIAEALYARLVAETTSANHVFPMRIPDDDPATPIEYPVLVYQQIAGPRGYSHDGGNGPHRFRWQITAWAETYGEARTLAEEVVAALSAWDDTSGTHVTRSVCFIRNEVDLYDAEARLYYVPIDAEVLVEP